MQTKTVFSREIPDVITEEIVGVLAGRPGGLAFKEIFETAYAHLKAKNAIRGGEETARLRCYEKVQGLISLGLVKKVEKKYKGVGDRLKALLKANPVTPTPAVVKPVKKKVEVKAPQAAVKKAAPKAAASAPKKTAKKK